ncbi:MAG: 3-hydroxyacyl-CoA dehydrogenase family protein [Bryobacteraceae bacterium]
MPVRTADRSTRGKQAPIEVGVVGLGLMARSIIACLLSAGHPVIGVSRSLARHRDTRRQILGLLREMKREGLVRQDPSVLIQQLCLSEDYHDLAGCGLVVESVIESEEIKKQVYRAVEEVVKPDAIVASNTSSIPLTILQAGALNPQRFVGLHWDEPAHITRFMEIISGEQTTKRYVDKIKKMAVSWGKEPSVLRRDVRGFITNRISYAMFREACHLVDSGVCTIEDVDRSLRNDVGWWITFAGPFRYMDLMGVQGYHRVMKDLLPELSSSPEIPAVIDRVVKKGGHGISTGRGFYRYTPAQAKRWEKLFLKFNYEIRRLALKYPAGIGDRVSTRSRGK